MLSHEEIEARIPHRPPFLWIDEVVALSAERIFARKHLAAEDEIFTGHFPKQPVLPGVIQLEACFQAAAVLLSELDAQAGGGVPVVTKAENARFKRLIRPEETMEIEVTLSDRVASAFYFVGKVSVAGNTASRVEFVCTYASV